MDKDELLLQINELEREIAILPEGSITKKNIKGKDYYYRRVKHNGKRIEIYIRFEELFELVSQINKRKDLEKKLKTLKSSVDLDSESKKILDHHSFRTQVRIGESLKFQIKSVIKFKKKRMYKRT